MKLSEWISLNGGRNKVAPKLGVTPEAIHYWLNQGIYPRMATMKKIEKLSKGRVTLSAIIAEVSENARGGR